MRVESARVHGIVNGVLLWNVFCCLLCIFYWWTTPILKTLGQFENLVFVLMSTRENICLIARTSLSNYPKCPHPLDPRMHVLIPYQAQRFCQDSAGSIGSQSSAVSSFSLGTCTLSMDQRLPNSFHLAHKHREHKPGPRPMILQLGMLQSENEHKVGIQLFTNLLQILCLSCPNLIKEWCFGPWQYQSRRSLGQMGLDVKKHVFGVSNQVKFKPVCSA